MTVASSASADITECTGDACGCTCSGGGVGLAGAVPAYRVFDASCSLLTCDITRSAWEDAAGSPRRAWTATGAAADLLDTSHPMFHFGNSGASAALAVYQCPVVSDGTVCPSIGVAEGQVGSRDATIDLATPMSAVWVTLAPTDPGCTGACGVLFQRLTEPGSTTYQTVASLRITSACGGVAVDVDALIGAGYSGDTLRFKGISRVVFQKQGGSAACQPRVHALGWRTIDAAIALRAAAKPYRLEMVDWLAAPAPVGVPTAEFGRDAILAMWPNTDYRFRMNSVGMIAGTMRVGLTGNPDESHLRAVVWVRDPAAPTGWSRLDLEPAAAAPGYDLIACALTEPFQASIGPGGATPALHTWVVVGGAKVVRCSGSSSDPQSCDNTHARAWLVRLGEGAEAPVAAVYPITVVGPTAGACDATLLDESVIEDLTVSSGTGGAVQILGAGRAGMWCAVSNGNGSQASIDLRGASQPAAAAFVLDPASLTGHTRMVDRIAANGQEQCTTGTPLDPNDPDAPAFLQVSHAHGWMRGDSSASGDPAFALVGDCALVNSACSTSNHGDPDVWCDTPWSARQWGWTGVPTPYAASDQSWLGTREWRATPSARGWFEGGVNVYQTFSAIDAWRSHVGTGSPARRVISAAGWLVDGCTSGDPNHAACFCQHQAALVEYREEAGAFWAPSLSVTHERVQTDATCLRALNLHAALWTPGTLGGVSEFNFSAASSVAAIYAGDSEFRRMVAGARFEANGSSLNPATSRGVLWLGHSPSLAADSSTLPDSSWCGRDVADLILSVRWRRNPAGAYADEPWASLGSGPSDPQGKFAPAVLSAHQVDALGSSVVIAWLSPAQPYVVARLRASADLSGDGRVDGADIGLLLAGWRLSGDSDLDASGTTNGADLGILLARWGNPIVWDCSSAEAGAGEIALVQHAAFILGFDSLDDFGDSLSLLPPSTASYLAEAAHLIAQNLSQQENGQ